MINLRGRVIPLMGLRLRFDLPESVYDERTCVVIVETEGEDGPARMDLAVDMRTL